MAVGEPESLKLDLGLLWNHDSQVPLSLNNCQSLMQSHEPEWRKLNILLEWCTEVNQAQHSVQTLEETWRHMFVHPQTFARQLRALGWCVYYYQDQAGLDLVPDFMAYVNYGKRWGLIVAPYCGRLTAWRLMQ